MNRVRTVVLGRAVTSGQALPLRIDDPVVAARAVRRALADANRKATDVAALVVASADPLPADVLAAFARRALGPHGAAVRVVAIMSDAAGAEILADRAAEDIASAGLAGDSCGLAVGIDSQGTTVALCLGGSSP